VRAGDTLYLIAGRFNTTVEAILAANPGIVPERLYIGQVICVPYAQPPQPACPIGTSPYEIKSGDTLSKIAAKFNTTVGDILNANPAINIASYCKLKFNLMPLLAAIKHECSKIFILWQVSLAL